MNVGLLHHLARRWWVFVLYGLIALVFGLFAIGSPLAAAFALVWGCGVMALAEGATGLLALFDPASRAHRGWLIVHVLASLVFGILALMDPLGAAGALVMLLAAWLVVSGLSRLAFALRLHRQHRGGWLLALSGLAAIVLGVLFVLDPLGGLWVGTLWIGAAALLYGVLQVGAGLRLRRLARSG